MAWDNSTLEIISFCWVKEGKATCRLVSADLTPEYRNAQAFIS